MADGNLRRLRRHPGYPLFYATATITRFADEMFSVGVVLLVLERTGSAALAGATVAAVTLPSLVTGPLLGAWLDRTSRRRQAMILDQVLAATSVVGIVVLAGNAPGWTLPLVALVAGVTWPLSFGGFTSLIPVIVPDELLAQANALEATSFNMAVIAGPALAGTISAVAGPDVSLIVEAVLTLAAIGLIARIPAIEARPEAADSGRALGTIVRDGLRHLAATPALRSVTATGALNLGGLGLLTVAFPFFAVEELGADRSVSGYMWAAFAGGSAIGALTLVRLQTRFLPERLVLVAVAMLGCVMLSWPLASTVPVALAVIALAGLADGPGLAATFGARQRWTPPELLGQIFTTAASLKVGAFAIGAAFAGPAVNTLGAPGTIVLAASAQFAAVAAGLVLGRRGRSVSAGLPAVESSPNPSGADPAPSPTAGLPAVESSPNPSGGLARDGSDLQQDDSVDGHRDRERDGPAVQVPLDERAAAERPGARAADAERTREPAVLARVQEHEEDQHDADADLDYRQDRVHGADCSGGGRRPGRKGSSEPRGV
jgi:predicted MFS family arabinose efflux permease